MGEQRKRVERGSRTSAVFDWDSKQRSVLHPVALPLSAQIKVRFRQSRAKKTTACKSQREASSLWFEALPF